MPNTPPTLPPFPDLPTRRVTSQPRHAAHQVSPPAPQSATLPAQRPISRPLGSPSGRIVSRPVSRPRPQTFAARLTRRFEIQWLDGGMIEEAVRVAPTLPVFEQAFGAFGHGVLVQTTEGPVAVEDLVPGMMLECANGRVSRLLWKGAITLVPGAPMVNDYPDRLYRVMPDAFGLGRPVQDQTFGPHARRLDRDPKVRATLGAQSALLPLAAQADGMTVIEVTPVSPTRVYHLACEAHEMILAGGLEVETYHPGPEAPLSLSDEMMQHFMSFFPYLDTIRDFGRLAAPRITMAELAAIG